MGMHNNLPYKNLTIKQIESAFAKQRHITRVFDNFIIELANKRQRKHYYDQTDIQIEGRLMLSLGFWSLCEMFYYSDVLYFTPAIGDIGMTITKRSR